MRTVTKEFILLEVDAQRADELRDALVKRSWIRIVDLFTVEHHNLYKTCPACQNELQKQWVATVSEQLIYACLRMLQAMKADKTTVVYNKSLIVEVRPIDEPRACQFPPKLLHIASLLGMVKYFKDGSQDTYYLSEAALKFLTEDAPLSPASVTVIGETPVLYSGSVLLKDLKVKDAVKFSETVIRLREAVKALQETTRQFVQTGQVPLI